MSGPLAGRIAANLHAIAYDDLPESARAWANEAIADTVGVTLAGTHEPCTMLIRDPAGTIAESGPALLLGTDRRSSILDAVLVNGTASHALDFDDVSGPYGGHPSVSLVPAMLAIGEARGLPGSDLLAAYVAGAETEMRIGSGVQFYHYDKGWHPTATLGVFGTVAVAARLLGLTVDETAAALSIAVSFASGVKANFGTMTKPLHVGHSGRNGVLACLLARQGYTASPSAFEHRQGFLEVFNEPGRYDAEKIVSGWGEPFAIEAGNMGLKQFPCCGSTHSSIEMMLQIVREHDVVPDDVTALLVRPHARRLVHVDNPRPRSPLAAKFSVQYGVARALLDRAVRLDHFEPAAIDDPSVVRILEITRAEPHPDMPEDSPERFGAEVTVTLRDGRQLSARRDHQLRRGPGGNPMSRAELHGKFIDCAMRVLEADAAETLFSRLMRLEDESDVASLVGLMAAPSGAGAPSPAPATASA